MLSTSKAFGSAAANAVRLSVWPAPASIAESREILRVIQRFGEVVTFKNLKYNHVQSAPNTMLAIFRSPESVADLLKESPLRFSLERVQNDEISEDQEEVDSSYEEGPQDIDDEIKTRGKSDTSRMGDEELLRRPGRLMNQPLAINTSFEEPAKPTRLVRRLDFTARSDFKVSADVWLGNHVDYLERSPYWGPFLLNQRSRIQQDLVKRVPYEGLSDIEYQHRKEIPLRILRKRNDDMEGRMKVREFYELACKESADSLEDPIPTTQSTPASHQLSNWVGDFDEKTKMLFRYPREPRRKLAFAQPPTNHEKTWEQRKAADEEAEAAKKVRKPRGREWDLSERQRYPLDALSRVIDPSLSGPRSGLVSPGQNDRDTPSEIRHPLNAPPRAIDPSLFVPRSGSVSPGENGRGASPKIRHPVKASSRAIDPSLFVPRTKLVSPEKDDSVHDSTGKPETGESRN